MLVAPKSGEAISPRCWDTNFRYYLKINRQAAIPYHIQLQFAAEIGAAQVAHDDGANRALSIGGTAISATEWGLNSLSRLRTDITLRSGCCHNYLNAVKEAT